VNVRVLDDDDPTRENPEIVHFDGQRWQAPVASLTAGEAVR
jgi:hypothetical protein